MDGAKKILDSIGECVQFRLPDLRDRRPSAGLPVEYNSGFSTRPGARPAGANRQEFHFVYRVIWQRPGALASGPASDSQTEQAMQTLQPKRARAALTLLFALTLAGCGGGGGSSSGGSGVSLNTLSTAVETSTARSAARNFAAATPRAGSVTQTSSTNAGVTQDTIAADAHYSGGTLEVTVSNTGSGGGTVALGNDGNHPGTVVVLRENNLRSMSNRRYRGLVLGRSTSGGTAFALVTTDRLTQADTDYLVGGVWLFVPPGATSTRDLEIGTFADGPDANLTPATYLAATSTATYRGDAYGLYLGSAGVGEYGGAFEGNIRLTANFGSTATVSGSISDVYVNGIGENTIRPLPGNPSLTLQSATISASAGGFFTGNTHASVAGYTYSGKWGGQFYGSQANSIGGTFGGSTSGNADGYEESFVGVFGAYKQ